MLPGVKNGAWRGTFFLPANAPSHSIPVTILSLIATVAVSSLISIGCEKNVSLVEPPPLFTFNPADAWSTNCSQDARSDPTRSNPAASGDQWNEREIAEISGIMGDPQPVPPPPGLFINACPNPAPPGTPEIVIEFRLDVQVSGVNIAIVNSRGEIVRVLMRDQFVERDRLTQASWLLDGVPPGDYRAYFRGGNLESFGDLKVD